MTDKKYEILYRETLFQGFFRVDRFHVRYERFDEGWSHPVSREVFSGGLGIAVVLLFDPHEDKVVLIEQFRAGPLVSGRDPWMRELVAGHIDPGETPEETARREAREEAGCEVQSLQKIFEYYPSCGCVGEYVTLFVGRTRAPEDGSIHGEPHEQEHIKLHVVDAAQAINALYMGQLRDAASIIAMQWFALHHTDLRSRWLVSDASTPII